jgi:excisionase family DNA binding protein
MTARNLARDNDASPWLTVQEAAAWAKVSPNLVYQNIKLGRLRAARLGFRNDLRIRVEWLEAWIEACSAPHDLPAGPVAEKLGPIKFTKRGRKGTEK